MPYQGPKYNPDLSTKAIAARVRDDLKAALPGVGVQGRSGRAGGGLCTVVLDEWKDVGLKPTYILAPMAADPDDEPEPFLVAPPPQCKWCGTLLETYESPCSFPYCNERNEEPCED